MIVDAMVVFASVLLVTLYVLNVLASTISSIEATSKRGGGR
jgi:hypothetical protein